MNVLKLLELLLTLYLGVKECFSIRSTRMLKRSDSNKYEEKCILKSLQHVNTTITIFFEKYLRTADLYSQIILEYPRTRQVVTKPTTYSGKNYIGEDFREVEKGKAFLFAARTFKSLQKQLYIAYGAKDWTPKVPLLLLLLEEEVSLKPLKEFVNTVMKVFTRRFMILVSNFNNSIDLISSEKVLNCFESTEIIHIGQCSENQLNLYLEPFQPTDYSSFYNCSVYIWSDIFEPASYVTKEGKSDGFFHRILTSTILDKMKLNYKPLNKAIDWCNKPTAEDGISDNNYSIYHPKYFMCTDMMDLGRFHPMNILDWAYYDSVILVVTKINGCETLDAILFRVLTLEFWGLHLISLVTMSVLWMIWAKRKSENIPQIGLNLIGLSLSFSVKHLTTTQLKFRILHLVWLFYAIHFTTLFQSKYTQLTSILIPLKQPKTVKDLEKKNIPIYHSEVDQHFEVYLTKEEKHLYQYINDSSTDRYHLKLIHGPKTIAIIQQYFWIASNYSKYVDPKTKQPNIYLSLDSALSVAYWGYVLKTKGHIFTETMNKWVHMVNTGGFMDLEKRRLLPQKEYIPENPNPNPLSVTDVKYSFYVLTFGSFISFLVYGFYG